LCVRFAVRFGLSPFLPFSRAISHSFFKAAALRARTALPIAVAVAEILFLGITVYPNGFACLVKRVENSVPFRLTVSMAPKCD
jgi:hypothetical protein